MLAFFCHWFGIFLPKSVYFETWHWKSKDVEKNFLSLGNTAQPHSAFPRQRGYTKFPNKGEFCSKHKEIYSSPTILFVSTESFTESCKQTLFTALSKRLSCVKYNGKWTVYFIILRAKFTFIQQFPSIIRHF